MFYTIYQTLDNTNGYIYIGKHQTSNINDSYLGSGDRLRHAIKKHGIENFIKTILFVFNTEQEMNDKEKELVTAEFCLREDTYNICEGGQGGFGYINDGSETHILRTRRGGKASYQKNKHKLELWSKSDRNKEYLIKNNINRSGGKASAKAKNNMKLSALKREKRYWIEKDGNRTTILEKDIDRYKQNGYIILREKNEELKPEVWINNGNINKLIKKEEYDHYTSIGFKRGRLT